MELLETISESKVFLTFQNTAIDLVCNLDGSWSINASDIPACVPVTCPMSLTVSPSLLKWDLNYRFYYPDKPPLATTSFWLVCKERNSYFVNKIANFTATCGWDG